MVRTRKAVELSKVCKLNKLFRFRTDRNNFEV